VCLFPPLFGGANRRPPAVAKWHGSISLRISCSTLASSHNTCTNKRTNERATTSSTEPLKTFASYVPAVEQDGRTAARCMKSADYTNLFLAPDLIWWRWRWCPLGVPYKDSTNDRTEYHLASLLFIDRKIALPRSNESSPDQRRSNKKIRLGSLFMVVMGDGRCSACEG